MARQEPESTALAGLERSALYGAAAQRAQRERDNDVALHTNQTMYSCGSLMANKRGADCCFDGTQTRCAPFGGWCSQCSVLVWAGLRWRCVA